MPAPITNDSLISTSRISPLSSLELARFQEDGFLVQRGLLPDAERAALLEVTKLGLVGEIPPVEFEADVQYPGSPASIEAEGGRTIRRLKQAYSRHPAFGEWMCSLPIVSRLQQLFGGQRVVMPLAHHNCIMTKQPQFSSDTLWHQDIRYWSYTRPDLISVWVALGREFTQNGCLWVLPGTHRQTFRKDQFDAALFFRTDMEENQRLISTQVPVELSPGDVLFFHCLTFHAASKNYTDQTKYSAVFTFRPWDNPPRPGSRSAAAPEILLPDAVDV